VTWSATDDDSPESNHDAITRGILAECNLGFVSMNQTSERTLDDFNDFFRGMC